MNWIEENFRTFETGLPGKAGNIGSEVGSLRKEAFARFCNAGFPTSANEDWHYTNIAAELRNGLSNSQVPNVKKYSDKQFLTKRLTESESPLIVFLDGYFVPELSSLDILNGRGVRCLSATEILSGNGSFSQERALLVERFRSSVETNDEPFVTLSNAFFDSGLFIQTPKQFIEQTPIEIICVVTSSAGKSINYPRVFVDVGEGSELTIVQNFIGQANEAYLTNSLTHLKVSEGAVCSHVLVQQEGDLGIHVSTVIVEQQSKSTCKLTQALLGGRVTRSEIRPVLNGEGCEHVINGLVLGHGEQHMDLFSVIDHAKPHCQSHEVIKGVYADKATGAFSGTIIVRQDAQKTNAIQSNNSILLSSDASVNSKPQLKIWADDVKCTHGATVGQIDEQALFYLRARGIDKLTAQHILIKAFADDVFSGITSEHLKNSIEALAERKLETRML